MDEKERDEETGSDANLKRDYPWAISKPEGKSEKRTERKEKERKETRK